MKKGAMIRVINLFEGLVYHNFTWMYLGFSGGSKQYKDQGEFIPDKMTHIYKIEYN